MEGTKFIEVEGVGYLSRDTYSKALINRNKTALAQYRQKKLIQEKQFDSIQKCSDDINTLKQELTDIKNTLATLVNSLKG
jgi:hypothetical protein